MLKICGWVLCLAFLGCGSTDWTASGPAAMPRALDCDFEILTSASLIGYREIGTVDVTPGAYGVNQYTDLSEFKDHIRESVCQLGGDAAIASANGYGMYIKASVMKRVAHQPPTPAVASAAAPAPKSHHAGCEFDTQCKGDRICVEGKCVADAPKASATVEPALPAPAPSAPPSNAASSPATNVPTPAAATKTAPKTKPASAP